ncbi:MAG: hypothetical protein AMJ89_03120 [candidate division Zixibacteria bacterium SM23_73]|nr:MAG: hypothetical protein AMJ89_03120 [candidate division Zixibacteria bacterium SM23_73]
MSKRKLQKKKRGKRMKMVKNKIVFLCLSFVIFFSPFVIFDSSLAQDLDFSDTDSWEISASNQLEYSLDRKNHQDIFHNWFDFNWTYDLYDVGLRYEAHQPDDLGKTYQELSYRYFDLSGEFLKLTVGNYYVMFGRGLILRSYENRDLRHDNNLEGIKGTIDLDGFDLTLLGGTPKGRYERINDPLHAVDGSIAFFDWMSLGGSYLRTNITDFGFVRLYGGNATLTFPHLDLYGEFARKDNPAERFIEKDGDGIYLSSNIYYTGFGVSLEYKDYERFDFTNRDVTYNNPPSLTKEHLYSLLNRHAYILNLYDERGFQVQTTSTPHEKLSLLANYSYTTDHKDKMIFSEIYGEAEYDYKDLATIKGGFSRMENKQVEGSPYYLAPVFDLTYYLSGQTSIAFVLEHLWTNKYDGDLTYYDQIISLGLSHSPIISLTFTHERTTEWKTRDWSGKKRWFVTTLGLSLGEKHNLSLSIGSRRAGKVCSGGVCTARPALDGWELKLLSQF